MSFFPTGLEASGDLAIFRGRLLATARENDASTNDTLVEFALDGSGTSRAIGLIGARCVWALAAFGSTLYGMNCEGLVLRIDPSNGQGTVLTRSGVAFNGATARLHPLAAAHA